MRVTQDWYDDYQRKWHARMAKADVSGLPQNPQPQRPLCHEPVGKTPGKDCHPPRYALRIVAYRTRLLDPDNLCPKYFLDGLRYAGVIADDTAGNISDYQIRQEKVATKAEERTVLEVTRL